MGNCGGRTTFESTIDDFFLEANLNHLNSHEVQMLITNNITNNQFCENKLEVFKANIADYLKSFSEQPEIREKTALFWQNSFEKSLEPKSQLYFLCCLCFLCNYDKFTLHRSFFSIAKFFGYQQQAENSNFIEKKDLRDIIDFYLRFITVTVLEYFRQTVKGNDDLCQTLTIVYRDEVRKIFLDNMMVKYEEKVDLEKFFVTEMDQLNHVNARSKFQEIHLKLE